MSAMDFIHSHWAWLILGLALIIFEIFIVPTSFLLWFGQAALATGLLVWAIPGVGWETVLLFFGVVSVTSLAMGRAFMKSAGTEAADNNLNHRMAKYIGREVEIVEAIQSGVGRAKLGDTTWRVKGPDAAVGSRLVVTAADGATLVVTQKKTSV